MNRPNDGVREKAGGVAESAPLAFIRKRLKTNVHGGINPQRVGRMLLIAVALIGGAHSCPGPARAQENLWTAEASDARAIGRKPAPAISASKEEGLFYQKALVYHREGKLNQAVQMYQQVIRVNPDHHDALFNLSSAYIQLASYPEAYSLLKKLQAVGHRHPAVLLNLAIVETGLERPAEAIRLLDAAADDHAKPQFGIYLHRAIALSRLGRLEEARTSYKMAEKLDADHPILLFNLALLSDKLQRYEEALSYYGKVLRQSGFLTPRETTEIEGRISTLRAYRAAQSAQSKVGSHVYRGRLGE